MQNLPSSNPLLGLMRKPKLKVKLPSQGKYWPAASIQLEENNEYSVYSMTAKDEMLLKNPASMTTGQTISSVIQSCIPSIKNANDTPSMDLDVLLLAIRIATYGNKMTIPLKVLNIEFKHEVDLNEILENLYNTISWPELLVINNELSIFVRPLLYKQVAQAGIETVETQKIMNIVNDDTISEEKKLELFKNSFGKLTKITIDVVTNSIEKIVSNDIEVTDPKYIQEFMEQCDREVFNTIKNHIDAAIDNNGIQPITITATPEMKKIGAEDQLTVPIEFNLNNFFV